MKIKDEGVRVLLQSLISITIACYDYLPPQEKAEKVIEILEKHFIIKDDEDSKERFFKKWRVGGDQ